MAHADVFRFIATVLRLALASFASADADKQVDILRGYGVSTVVLADIDGRLNVSGEPLRCSSARYHRIGLITDKVFLPVHIGRKTE